MTAAAAACVLCTGGDAGAVDNGAVVSVPQYADASNPLIEPRSWTPTGNGSLRFEKIAWRSFGRARATATVVAIASDCDPSCADGSVIRKRLRITVSGLRVLECNRDLYTYTQLRMSKRLPRRPRTITFSACTNRFN